MNFYEHQALARRQTKRLLLLFLLSLVAIIVLTAFFVACIAYFLGLYPAYVQTLGSGHPITEIAALVFDWSYLGMISLAVLSVVALAAFWRMVQLSSGGRVIAEQMGGRLLNSYPRDADEKKLLNVVEEMSIAAGIPVPSVYLIEEEGINAFAAGYQTADAVIGITRGAMTRLSRQELQGVVAHEFSHILNGDMRLNLRLIGIIFGIIAIATAGRYLLRGGRYSRRDRGAAVGIGLALVILGYLGVFFGNMIKAAVSRQREFLADASAVQFTRSKEGIAGALKKIGGQHEEAVWHEHDASEISHMLFSPASRFSFMNRMMATHPPLETRIKRIDPQWQGGFDMSVKEDTAMSSTGDGHAGVSGLTANQTLPADALAQRLDSPIYLSDKALACAKSHLESIRADLSQEVHQPYTARAFIFAMLIHHQHDRAKDDTNTQWQSLASRQDPVLYEQTQIIFEKIQALDPIQVMTLLDLCLPILKLLSASQYQSFKEQMLLLIRADKKIELREWALFSLVKYYCRPPVQQHFTQLDREYRLSQCKQAVSQLLSALTYVSQGDEEEAKAIFFKVAKNELNLPLNWYSQGDLDIRLLSESLNTIRKLKPLEKPRFIKACIKVIEHNGILSHSELELVCCITQAMDCPLTMVTELITLN